MPLEQCGAYLVGCVCETLILIPHHMYRPICFSVWYTARVDVRTSQLWLPVFVADGQSSRSGELFTSVHNGQYIAYAGRAA